MRRRRGVVDQGHFLYAGLCRIRVGRPGILKLTGDACRNQRRSPKKWMAHFTFSYDIVGGWLDLRATGHPTPTACFPFISAPRNVYAFRLKASMMDWSNAAYEPVHRVKFGRWDATETFPLVRSAHSW